MSERSLVSKIHLKLKRDGGSSYAPEKPPANIVVVSSPIDAATRLGQAIHSIRNQLENTPVFIEGIDKRYHSLTLENFAPKDSWSGNKRILQLSLGRGAAVQSIDYRSRTYGLHLADTSLTRQVGQAFSTDMGFGWTFDGIKRLVKMRNAQDLWTQFLPDKEEMSVFFMLKDLGIEDEEFSSAIMFEHTAFLIRKPIEEHWEEYEVDGGDRFHRLHKKDGPAIQWADGASLWALEGIAIPKIPIKGMNAVWIDKLRNQESRRVAMREYGEAVYLEEIEAVELNAEEAYGTLFRSERDGHDTYTFIRVTDATEKDGEFQQYFIRVPNNLSTAKAAAAWTFEQDEVEYAPIQQT